MHVLFCFCFFKMNTCTLLWCWLLVEKSWCLWPCFGAHSRRLQRGSWSVSIVSDTDGAEIFLLYRFQKHIHCTSLLWHRAYCSAHNWGTGSRAHKHACTLVHKHIYMLPLALLDQQLWVFSAGNWFLTKTEALHIFLNCLWHLWLRLEGCIQGRGDG